MKTNGLAALIALTAGLMLGASGAAMAQGGNGNGGAGGGNAHGAATAAPTAGGDNTSAATGTSKGFHFKHKKKAKPVTTPAQ